MSWTSVHPQDSRKRKNMGQMAEEGNIKKPINVVLATWTGDQHQAKWLLKWIAEMGMVQAPFHLACSKECDYQELLTLANSAFSVVHFMEDRENMKSNWHEPGDHPKSASGPNSLFRQVAWHFYLSKLGPWLFLEPDAIPCVRDWYQRIATDYELGRKPFMGFGVNPFNHPGVPPHLSGVAVYPQDTPQLAPKAVNPGSVAFDIAGVDQILPQAHHTQVIYHRYRAPGFTDQADFDTRVPNHLALYHACKDGSIYNFLKRRLGIKETIVTGAEITSMTPEPIIRPNGAGYTLEPTVTISGGGSASLAPICDIFIKTHKQDADWLKWCIKSIERFATGFRKTIIVGDTDAPDFIPEWIEWRREDELKPGYLFQQSVKLRAYQYTDAKYILFLDSDCVFVRPVSPSDFIQDGKPIWLYDRMDNARDDQKSTWSGPMERFVGQTPEIEGMRRHPHMMTRQFLEELGTFCLYRHHKTIHEYIMGLAVPNNPLALVFSEFNCSAWFAWSFRKDDFIWKTPDEAGPAFVHQGFTWGGEKRKSEDLAKFAELLAEPIARVGHSQPEREVTCPAPVLTEKEAISFLASIATDNIKKARIVRALKNAWKHEQGTEKSGLGGVGLSRVQRTAPKRSSGKNVVRQSLATLSATFLLCVHSYPGANETILRHQPYFEQSGASRIVGIGTTDGKCEFPWESVNIGENRYMKMKGPDDNLCRRLLDTVKWCLTQPEDRYAICEYDTIFLKPLPQWEGVNAHLTGGQLAGAKTSRFYHNPWLLDRGSGEALVKAMEAVLPESAEYPDNSPDLFFGLACERAHIEVKCNFQMFTRNTLDHDLDLAQQAIRDGAHVIHGCKTEAQLNALLAA